MIKLLKICNEAQIEWAKKRQERLDYINNEIMKEQNSEERFTDLNSAMQRICY